MLEGFGSDQALSNSTHLLNAANESGLPVPYQDTGFNYQRDLAGYIQNQQHGFRGDGMGPIIDPDNRPNKIFQAEMAKPPGEQYIPHLLSKEKAEFINAAMNIVPSGTTKPESKRPTFSENAQWLSRVNQGYIGQEGAVNRLREELDRRMPHVGMRNKAGKVTRHVPWSKGVLEPTYRAYRLDLIHSTLPSPLEAQSLRAREGVPHEPHIIMKAPVAVHTAAEFKIPAWQKPSPPQGLQEGGLVSPVAKPTSTEIALRLMEPGIAEAAQANPEGIHATRLANLTKRIDAMPPSQRAIYENPGVMLPSHLRIPGNDAPSVYAQADGTRVPWSMLPNGSAVRTHDAITSKGIRRGKIYVAGIHSGAEMAAGGPRAVKESGVVRNGVYVPNLGLYSNMVDASKAEPLSAENFGNHLLVGKGLRRVTPTAENPEVGAPIGEGQTPVGVIHMQEGGLVPATSAEQPGQETAPEPARENNAQTFEAVSPSIRTDQTYTGAKRSFNRPQHAAFRDFNDRLEGTLANEYGYNQASSADTIGDWSDGAENTIANESQGQDYQHRRIASALKGLHSAQKQTLLFQHDDEGPHALYRLKFNTDKDEEVRKLLDEAGIGMRTLYPSKAKGEPVQVHVADLNEDAKLLPAIEKLIQDGHVTEAWQHAGRGELLGDKNGESRQAAATQYRRILQEAREGWHQARAGGTAAQDYGAGGDQAPWFDPFQREAEENFAKLKASDDYKKDARAQSLRSADLDRKNISLERERELAQNKQKAQDWIATAEETNPLSAHHFLDKHEEFPENVEKNEHVGEFFNARNEKLDYNKAEDRSTAANALLHDVMHSLSRNSNAVGWYSETVRKAFDKFSEIAPELKTDRASNLAFRLALAITSQGQNVFDNADSAWKVYQYWRQRGKFPTENAKEVFGGGIKSPQMEFNFAKANRLWKEHGSAEKFEDWLNQTIRHSKLQKDYKMKIGSTLAEADVPMSAVFGPKIGVFFQNLSGNEEPVTMDVWFSRTMNRLAANMFGFSSSAMREDRGEDKAHLTTLRELLDSGQITGVGEKDQAKMRKEISRLMAAKNLDRDRAMKLAPTIRNWAEQQHGHFAETITGAEGKTRGYHPDRKTAENQNAKNIDENFKALQADPRNGTERANWIKVMDEVREKMQKAGINMTNADRQAMLWYLEQRLFQGVTGARETSYDYLDAAHDLVRKVKEGSL
jgi:hypothetical protein